MWRLKNLGGGFTTETLIRVAGGKKIGKQNTFSSFLVLAVCMKTCAFGQDPKTSFTHGAFPYAGLKAIKLPTSSGFTLWNAAVE